MTWRRGQTTNHKPQTSNRKPQTSNLKTTNHKPQSDAGRGGAETEHDDVADGVLAHGDVGRVLGPEVVEVALAWRSSA
eukprot:2289771-Rhodomonas_salina.1